MAIAATDLIAYAAASMPEDESSGNGGAINPDMRVVFTDLAANDDVEVLSAAAGDTTQQVTLVGRKADGSQAQETVTLNGVTAVIFSTLGVIERVQKVSMASDAAGIVTVRRSVAGATISTIPIGERGFQRLFIGAYSDPSAPKAYYMKFFWKNAHATLALLTALVKQNADPTGLISHLIAGSVNDSATTANRITAPAVGDTLDPDTFDDNNKAVPGTNLSAGAAIGVWVKLSLATGNAPIKDTYTSEMSGEST